MKTTLHSIWTSWGACLLVIPVVLFGAAILGASAVGEAFSNYQDSCRNIGADCHEPRNWVMIPLALLTLALLGVAEAAFLRALVLIGAALARRGASGA